MPTVKRIAAANNIDTPAAVSSSMEQQQQHIAAAASEPLHRGIVRLPGFNYNPATMAAPDGRPLGEPNGLSQEVFDKAYVAHRIIQQVALHDDENVRFVSLVEGFVGGESLRELPQSGSAATSDLFNQAAIIDQSRFTGNIPGYVNDLGKSEIKTADVIADTVRFTEPERVKRALHSDVTLMLPTFGGGGANATMLAPLPNGAAAAPPATLSLATHTPHLLRTPQEAAVLSPRDAPSSAAATSSSTIPALNSTLLGAARPTSSAAFSESAPALPASLVGPSRNSASASAAAAAMTAVEAASSNALAVDSARDAAAAAAAAAAVPDVNINAAQNARMLGDGSGGNRNDNTETLSNIITRDKHIWWNINDGRTVAVRMIAESKTVNESTLKLWDLIYNDGRLYTINANRANDKQAAFRSRARSAIADYADSLTRGVAARGGDVALSWRFLPEHIGFLFLKPHLVTAMRAALARVKSSLSTEYARTSLALRQTLQLRDMIRSNDPVCVDFAELVALFLKQRIADNTQGRDVNRPEKIAKAIAQKTVKFESLVMSPRLGLTYSHCASAASGASYSGYTPSWMGGGGGGSMNTAAALQQRDMVTGDMLLGSNRYLNSLSTSDVRSANGMNALMRLGSGNFNNY
jgi:hypothetical protein